MRNKKIKPVIASLAIMMALVGCSNGAKDTDTTVASSESAKTTETAKAKDTTLRIAWWGTQARNDATNKVLDMYKQLHPNISFEPEFQGFDGYFQKLSLQAATNNMPDVMQFFVNSGDTQQFLDKNLVASLDDLVANGTIDTSNISESALSTGKVNGKLYGIPVGLNARAMAVDVAAYQKAGLTIPEKGYATWEDLGKDLVKLKAVTGTYGADDILNETNIFPYYARQMGQTQFANDTGIGFDEKTYVDFYTMKSQWMKDGLIPPVDVNLAAKGVEDTMTAKNKAAITFVNANQFPTLSQAAGRELKLIPLPGPNGEKAMDLRPSQHISIPESSSNKEEAAKFISYFINDVDANKVLNGERGIPVSSSIRDVLKEGFTPEQVQVAEYIDYVANASSPMDPTPPNGSTEINNLMLDLEQQILYNKITPQQAYEKLKTQAVEITQKNK